MLDEKEFVEKLEHPYTPISYHLLLITLIFPGQNFEYNEDIGQLSQDSAKTPKRAVWDGNYLV